MKTGRSSVQGVGSVIDGQLVFFVAKLELSFGNTVTVTSDQCAEERLR